MSTSSGSHTRPVPRVGIGSSQYTLPPLGMPKAEVPGVDYSAVKKGLKGPVFTGDCAPLPYSSLVPASLQIRPY